MATTITVPQEYGYVIATTVSTFFLSNWHGLRIGSFRKAAGIRPPQYYAESSDMASATPEKKEAMQLLNCAQRSHANYDENHPSVAIAMLIAGVQYPMTTTALGVGWVITRIMYAVGYTSKPDGKGRLPGLPFILFQWGLFGLSAWSGIKMVM